MLTWWRTRCGVTRRWLWGWLGTTLALALVVACVRVPRSSERARDATAASVPIDWSRVHPRPARSFREAKRWAEGVYADHRVTFYCACAYDRGLIEAASCGYVPLRHGRRSRHLEWEHLVPAAAFGRHRSCWREEQCTRRAGRRFKGRECCRQRDPQFAAMEADLHNLVPAIGELNGARSDYAFGTVAGEPRDYGACDFEVDNARRVVEPADRDRGAIARAYLYLYYAYGAAALPLSPEQVRSFELWHRQYPPSAWERERDRRIARLQGAGNPLVQH